MFSSSGEQLHKAPLSECILSLTKIDELPLFENEQREGLIVLGVSCVSFIFL